MSKTDKTRPVWVRLREAGAVENDHRGWDYDHIPADFKWRNDESNAGPGYIKWAKQYKSKKNRRRTIPLTKMSGRGYVDENYKFQ